MKAESDGDNLTTIAEFQYTLNSLGFIACAYRNPGLCDIQILDLLPPVSITTVCY